MEITSEYRTVHPQQEPPPQCSRGTERSMSHSAPGSFANGFLKHRFLPLYQAGEQTPDKQMERDFFNSLSRLARSRGFEPMDVSGKAFPYNMILAHWDAKNKLRTANDHLTLHLMQDENGNTNLATRETYDTGNYLYYIPVLPLYRLLQDHTRKKSAELLLSVFAFLFQVARIPYYRQDNTYLYWQYELMDEWLGETYDEWEKEDFEINSSEIRRAQIVGDIIARKIRNPYHLESLDSRLDKCCPHDSFDRECHRLAIHTYELMQDFPNRNYLHHVPGDREDGEDSIFMNQYISFIADHEGWLYESIAEMVNNTFNECLHTDEPVAVTVYDRLHLKPNSLEYEQHLFSLIKDICTLLNHLP